MARPLRIEFENAFYHVMNRGAAHEDIYITDDHRKMFLELLIAPCQGQGGARSDIRFC